MVILSGLEFRVGQANMSMRRKRCQKVELSIKKMYSSEIYTDRKSVV